MSAFVAAVRRIVRQDGEAILERAVSGLEKAKTRLHDAAERIAADINREQQAIAAEREKFWVREAYVAKRVDGLSVNWQRAMRVASRIAGLVE